MTSGAPKGIGRPSITCAVRSMHKQARVAVRSTLRCAHSRCSTVHQALTTQPLVMPCNSGGTRPCNRPLTARSASGALHALIVTSFSTAVLANRRVPVGRAAWSARNPAAGGGHATGKELWPTMKAV